MYGITFVILGNRTGNAILMGQFFMKSVAGRDGTPSETRGIAAVMLTLACIIHASWRKGGIVLNNAIALLKVGILLTIIVIGFAASAGASFGHRKVPPTSNFDVHSSFAKSSGDAAGFVSSFLIIFYTLHGFDQPFSVGLHPVCLNL
jgi:amino acid transporter